MRITKILFDKEQAVDILLRGIFMRPGDKYGFRNYLYYKCKSTPDGNNKSDDFCIKEIIELLARVDENIEADLNNPCSDFSNTSNFEIILKSLLEKKKREASEKEGKDTPDDSEPELQASSPVSQESDGSLDASPSSPDLNNVCDPCEAKRLASESNIDEFYNPAEIIRLLTDSGKSICEMFELKDVSHESFSSTMEVMQQMHEYGRMLHVAEVIVPEMLGNPHILAVATNTKIMDPESAMMLIQVMENNDRQSISRLLAITYHGKDRCVSDYVNRFFAKLGDLHKITEKQLQGTRPYTSYFDIPLENFTLLTELMLGGSVFCILILVTWLYRNNSGFILQKPLCEVFSLIFLMISYLYYNELLIVLNSSFNRTFLNDDFAKIAKFLVSLMAAAYFLILAYSFKEQSLTSPEYTLLLSFSILGLLIACSGNDLLTLYLSLELISLSSYVLSAFKKSQYSCESGLKYFIIGSLSSAFFIFGSSLLYLETGSIYLSDYTDLFWYTHKTNPETVNTHLMDMALSFIFFSLFIKLICAPFHLWSLDVYEESPSSSSFYFATITKLSLFIVLIRVSFYIFFKLCFVWVTFFTFIGMLSAFIGALGGLRQKKFKTLLAYSSITNMGYALIVLGGFSDTSIWAMLVHVIIYQFTGLCVWSLLTVVRLKRNQEKYSKELSDLSLLKKANISLAFAFALTLFSLAGIPPLLGFAPKIFIISEVLQNNIETAAVFLALCSVVATFYYIRVIKIVFFENLLSGKLYSPALNIYSIALSFFIHGLLYTFLDIGFLSASIVTQSVSIIWGLSSWNLAKLPFELANRSFNNFVLTCGMLKKLDPNNYEGPLPKKSPLVADFCRIVDVWFIWELYKYIVLALTQWSLIIEGSNPCLFKEGFVSFLHARVESDALLKRKGMDLILAS
jgi:NADH-quinone oxidoreductase subunit N